MTELEDNEMEVDIAQNEQNKLKSKMDDKDKDRFGEVPKVTVAVSLLNESP